MGGVSVWCVVCGAWVVVYVGVRTLEVGGCGCVGVCERSVVV